MTTKKKKIQVNIERDLAKEVDEVLDSLGMNPTVLITALYKRVAAKGEIPFDLSLTEKEKSIIELQKAVELIPTEEFNTSEEFLKWLDEA
ncbi:hypothetical protein GCM10008932_02800 [Alkalibacterium iburiense]|uniref:Damage-inducible protein J n=1 Tax=Alkalibacterium iburiense TaxID=290589 RepID=A0ABP3GVS1_9LACT